MSLELTGNVEAGDIKSNASNLQTVFKTIGLDEIILRLFSKYLSFLPKDLCVFLICYGLEYFVKYSKNKFKKTKLKEKCNKGMQSIHATFIALVIRYKIVLSIAVNISKHLLWCSTVIFPQTDNSVTPSSSCSPQQDGQEIFRLWFLESRCRRCVKKN